MVCAAAADAPALPPAAPLAPTSAPPAPAPLWWWLPRSIHSITSDLLSEDTSPKSGRARRSAASSKPACARAGKEEGGGTAWRPKSGHMRRFV
eukprot:273730-Chlamydomonas_euryale.AAC.1